MDFDLDKLSYCRYLGRSILPINTLNHISLYWICPANYCTM